MTKKKIGVFIDWFLPGTRAGGPVRSIQSLTSLLKDDFEISVITTNTDLGSTTAYDSIEPNVWIEKDGVRVFYFSKEQLSKNNLLQLITDGKFDILYLNSFWSYWFSICIVQQKKNGTLKQPVVLAPRGMLGKGALEIKSFKKKVYLKFAQWKNLYKDIHFHATNEQEKKDILSFFSKAQITIAENLNGSAFIRHHREKKQGELNLFYLSRIVPIKNLHLALNLLAQLPKHITATYTIFGNIEDQGYWNSCLSIIEKMPDNIKVQYQGELPFDKIQQSIKDYHALLLPTSNENFGHSIVESLSSGCAVVISDQTPWTDVTLHKAGAALNLNDEKGFLQALETLAMMNQAAFDKTSDNAIDYITEKLNVNLIREKYIHLFDAAR